MKNSCQNGKRAGRQREPVEVVTRVKVQRVNITLPPILRIEEEKLIRARGFVGLSDHDAHLELAV